MSDPSIYRPLDSQVATVDTASDDLLRKAFIGAFHTDLPPGYAKVKGPVEKMCDRKDRAMLALDPNSEEGKQFACPALVFGTGLIRVCSRRSSVRPMP
ncbi:MAG: hypothetical protein QNJ30_16390 [Kiloniellales bacterium]|nr:hypothetical protein [Kiloniellales bacterium]